MKISNANNLFQYEMNENIRSYAEQFPNVMIGVLRIWTSAHLLHS